MNFKSMSQRFQMFFQVAKKIIQVRAGFTYVVDKSFDFGLHPPVFELDATEFVGTHQRFAIGQW